MSIEPFSLGATLPDAMPEVANKTTLVLRLSYDLGHVGYPGSSDQSVLLLSDRLQEYSKTFLGKSMGGLKLFGSISNVAIGQNAAWVFVICSFEGEQEKVIKRLEELGFEFGSMCLSYSYTARH